jgi:Aspartyl protease
MPHFTFPITKDGCTLDVLVGLGHADMQAVVAAGQHPPPPLNARAILDTGSDKTAVIPRLLQQLGIRMLGSAQTHTAAGLLKVRLYEVSLSVPNPTGARTPMLVRPQWAVTEFLHPPPGIDVLLGMDLVRECLSILDGPGAAFTLAF